jgi:hypothetical protein
MPSSSLYGVLRFIPIFSWSGKREPLIAKSNCYCQRVGTRLRTMLTMCMIFVGGASTDMLNGLDGNRQQIFD